MMLFTGVWSSRLNKNPFLFVRQPLPGHCFITAAPMPCQERNEKPQFDRL
jgi:hypothetical protein